MAKEKSQQSLIVYYDDQCGICTGGIHSLQKYGALSGVKYEGLSDAPKVVQKLSEKNNSWIIAHGEEYFVGYAGFVEYMKQSRVFGFYGYIGNIPPLNTIGNIIYRIISSRRTTCRIHKK